MVRHARNALTEIAQAQDEFTALRSGLAGHVAIGTVITSATQLVPLAVARLKQRFPRIVVSIDVDFSKLLIERLVAGRLDVVIARIHNLPDVAELEYEGLVKIRTASSRVLDTRLPTSGASRSPISRTRLGFCHRRATCCAIASRSCSPSTAWCCRSRTSRPHHCQ